MKGFLTFTLVAGVALTTTSIAQAEGVVKGPANAGSAQVSMPGTAGSMGVVLDRGALVRELERLSAPSADLLDGAEDSQAPVRSKSGTTWVY